MPHTTGMNFFIDVSLSLLLSLEGSTCTDGESSATVIHAGTFDLDNTRRLLI